MNSLSLASRSWQFRAAGSRTWLPAQVPGCVHADLHRAGRISDPFWGRNELALQWIEHRDWEYRTSFRVPPELWAWENVELVADGLDTLATVFLNGRELARTDNMFVGWRWPVRPRLRPGANDLRIVFASIPRHLRHARPRFTPPVEYNDPVGGGTRVRKQQCQFGWDWGPRFVTAGIWRDLRLEGWSHNRLTHVRVSQQHGRDRRVTLRFAPGFAHRDATIRLEGTVSLGSRVVATVADHAATIEHPALWWPNGHGAQPLYEIDLCARDAAGREIGRWRRRLGLRTIALDRRPDRWGESFRFVVNGRPVFIKGANWIPAHAFVADLRRPAYARDLRAAAAAHMNCVRVWGGGVYEHEDFYDLCDELGLLVWQDFMFACTLSPGDRAFLRRVRTEAVQQVRRLQHRACLALWCGNNEVAQLNETALARRRWRRGYEALFHRLLPSVVADEDGVTPYRPSSPWRDTWRQGFAHEKGTQRGDTHFWDVWHARAPVKSYERWPFRFVSEFGMQSFVSPATQATFCPPDDANVFGPAMENHQKNRAGNQIVLDYIARRYRYPKSQADLIYLSQLNQAHCVQTGVEHLRRSMPRCMGAIYWQLNDCWPVASWSSIEFTGRWKALHFLAKRFYAPTLLSAEVVGQDHVVVGNYQRSTVRKVHLYTVHDGPHALVAWLRWDLLHVTGRRVSGGRQRVHLAPGRSVRQLTVDLARPIARYGREQLYLRVALDHAGKRIGEETVFLTPPRFMPLPRGKIEVGVRKLGPLQAEFVFRSAVFHHRVDFDLPATPHLPDDNYFELYPGKPKTIRVGFERPINQASLARDICIRSLVDTYD